MDIIPWISFNSIRIKPDLINFHFLFLILLFLFSLTKIFKLLFYFNYLLLKVLLELVPAEIINILSGCCYYVLPLQIFHLLKNGIGNYSKQILKVRKSLMTLVPHQLMFSGCQHSHQNSIVRKFADFILNDLGLFDLCFLISF